MGMNTAGIVPRDSSAEAGSARPAGPNGADAAALTGGTTPVPDLPAQRQRTPDLDSLIHLPEPGPLVASGTSADVFAISEDHVVRRYRSGRDACAEVAILTHVRSFDYPAPTVLAAEGPQMLMDRLHGPTLLQAVASGEVALSDAATILADLHRRLHSIPAPAIPTARAASWPPPHPGPTVVHLDLHPGNVVLTENLGPAVVDWSNAGAGPAELDVAMTALIIAEVAVDAGGIYSLAARALLVAFLQAVDEPVLAGLDAATAIRRSDPTLVAGEEALVPAAEELIRQLVEVARHQEHAD